MYSATAAAAAREKPPSYNAAAEEEACGICHDPAEDSVVYLPYTLIPLLQISNFTSICSGPILDFPGWLFWFYIHERVHVAFEH